MAGVVAYWAEGAKIGVTDDRIAFRLQIHESADAEQALRFWAESLGRTRATFLNTTLKKHDPKTVRSNVGDTYHGCLCVEVRRSADLNLQIDGWCEGLAAAAQATASG